MTTAAAIRALPFENGDVLSRQEFHRLYSQCEELEHVEFIEGVVYLPTPIRYEGHTEEQWLVFEWLAAYRASHPDVDAGGPTGVLLDDENEPEPDAILFRRTSDAFEDGYLARAPELIVEIASTSASRDLHQKKRAYERNGVREYIVWRTKDKAIDWFRLVGVRYEAVQPDRQGIIESAEFPGLRLDVKAMLAKDRKKVLAALTAR